MEFFENYFKFFESKKFKCLYHSPCNVLDRQTMPHKSNLCCFTCGIKEILSRRNTLYNNWHPSVHRDQSLVLTCGTLCSMIYVEFLDNKWTWAFLQFEEEGINKIRFVVLEDHYDHFWKCRICIFINFFPYTKIICSARY